MTGDTCQYIYFVVVLVRISTHVEIFNVSCKTDFYISNVHFIRNSILHQSKGIYKKTQHGQTFTFHITVDICKKKNIY